MEVIRGDERRNDLKKNICTSIEVEGGGGMTEPREGKIIRSVTLAATLTVPEV